MFSTMSWRLSESHQWNRIGKVFDVEFKVNKELNSSDVRWDERNINKNSEFALDEELDRNCQILGAFKRSHLKQNIISERKLHKCPCHEADSYFCCIPQRIWYQNVLNLAKISKTAGFLHHILTSREAELSLSHSQEFVWILLLMFEPKRPTLIFFTIFTKMYEIEWLLKRFKMSAVTPISGRN